MGVFNIVDKYIEKIKSAVDAFWIQDGYGTRFQEFQNLMRSRIRDVLIVSSLYDFYIFEEYGRLYELIRSEYQGLNLSHTPELTRVSSGKEALELIKGKNKFDLIITTLHIEGMRPAELARKLRKLGLDIPIVMLAFDNRELADMLAHKEDKLFDHIFIWLGDYRLLLAIIKSLEDINNVEHDTHVMGVQSILVIEDTIRFYSFLLPSLYLEIMQQSQRFIKEGVNLSHKNLRQRARPKILLCRSYEEAWRNFTSYHETVLGIISDVNFPRKDGLDSEAGFTFAEEVHAKHPDIPILFHSALEKNEIQARTLGCHFVLKDSPTFLKELRQFMASRLSFGDFVFRVPDGTEVGRAQDLLTLEKQLRVIPEKSLVFHSERNDFSHWLKARTEFWLAYNLRPRKVSEFPSVSALRSHLIEKVKEYRIIRQRGIISDFDKELFEPTNSISRIGGGSLGGKARGLGFFNTLINSYSIQDHFENVHISVPPAVIIATDIFDQFMEMNALQEFALTEEDDFVLLQRFMDADNFPEEAVEDLKDFLEMTNHPLAVRSSGLLEDSHVHPFAGVYGTFMIPNCHNDLQVRLFELLKAVKRVYASTYFKSARGYIQATSFQLEEEKMAVIVQTLSGSAHGGRYYPILSGTAQSYNFYPISPQESSDGIASIALGLGKMVVEGGASLRFSPRYPRHIVQLSTPELALNSNQHDFFALNLCSIEEGEEGDPDEDINISRFPLKTAEQDDTLRYVGSIYSPENHAIYDGITREGVPLVSFAPILKQNIFPLAHIIDMLLTLGSWSMGMPVDIEFAVDLALPEDQPKKFSLLQIRPMVLARELESVTIETTEPKKLIGQSDRVLGNGIIDDIHDIVFIDRDVFDRSKSREVAAEVKRFNAILMAQQRPFLLIGFGRWGSMDPWLGIPVKWEHISGARVIIEANFKDFTVDPSQGSHFLENLNSFSVGYFTVPYEKEKSFVDWEWLQSQTPIEKMSYTKLLRFDKRLLIKMNGRESFGIIFKPGMDS